MSLTTFFDLCILQFFDFKLGKWIHAFAVETVDDVLADPKSIPYTQKTDNILSPHTDILKKLFEFSSNRSTTGLEDTVIPAKDFLASGKNKKFGDNIFYSGTLSITERAEISNWIHRHISDNSRMWFQKLTHAHAMTLYIRALLIDSKPDFGTLDEAEQLEKAWDIQFNTLPPFYEGVDVDRECIDRLEEEMFEVSERAGSAGNHQWGLDAGDHQYWYPYDAYWHTGEREEDEEETKVS